MATEYRVIITYRDAGAIEDTPDSVLSAVYPTLGEAESLAAPFESPATTFTNVTVAYETREVSEWGAVPE